MNMWHDLAENIFMFILIVLYQMKKLNGKQYQNMA